MLTISSQQWIVSCKASLSSVVVISQIHWPKIELPCNISLRIGQSMVLTNPSNFRLVGHEIHITSIPLIHCLMEAKEYRIKTLLHVAIGCFLVAEFGVEITASSD
jgi:hypothetical protein